MIYKANRVQLLDEGTSQGWARSVNVVGTNFAATVAADAGTITWSGREKLTNVRTYFVRTDGSDSNTGLVDSAGGAYLTIAKALTTMATLDFGAVASVIQLGTTGSYAGATLTGAFIGGTNVSIIGSTGAPSSYVITSGITISHARIQVSGLDFTPSSGDALVAGTNGVITVSGACVFGTCAARQIVATNNGLVAINAACTIDGGATSWIAVGLGGSVVTGSVHTFSGTPAFSTATVQALTRGMVQLTGTPSGAATGKRYDTSLNGVIFTNGGGANFIPGDVAGTTATGGQYA